MCALTLQKIVRLNISPRGGFHLHLNEGNVVEGFSRANTDAELAGINIGDRIIGMNAAAVRNKTELEASMSALRANTTNAYDDCPVEVTVLYQPTTGDLMDDNEDEDLLAQSPEDEAAERVAAAVAPLKHGLAVPFSLKSNTAFLLYSQCLSCSAMQCQCLALRVPCSASALQCLAMPFSLKSTAFPCTR